MEIKYDHTKLKSRIREKYGSFAKYAEAFGTTKATLSLKLNNKANFTLPEIETSLSLLDIPRNEIYDYYLTPIVADNDFDYSQIEGLVELKETIAAQIEWAMQDDPKGEMPNPISFTWRYPQAMAYYSLENKAEDYGDEIAAKYLKQFQVNPAQWESIMKQYEEESEGGCKP